MKKKFGSWKVLVWGFGIRQRQRVRFGKVYTEFHPVAWCRCICKIEKEVYQHSLLSGRSTKCRVCSDKERRTGVNNQKRIEWRLENKVRLSGYRRRWREKNRERVKETQLRYDLRYPEKEVARNRVAMAVRNGKLKRLPCATCGEAKTDAHHEDYSKPLDVIWLCRNHHSRRHQNKEKHNE